MILGEYNISMNPSTPDAEKTIYSTKPTTTGGILIKVLTNIVIMFLPKNSVDAI